MGEKFLHTIVHCSISSLIFKPIVLVLFTSKPLEVFFYIWLDS